MSVYFVYRSHYDNPGAFHVKVFPQDTVLEWFRSIWQGIPDKDRAPFPSEAHARELIGQSVYSFGSLFTSIHEHGWPPPKTMTTVAQHFRDAMYTQEVRFGQHHIQLLTDDDELEMAVYIFDDHYAKKNPHRAAFLTRQDWKLPDGAADDGFKPHGARKSAKVVRGEGVTYFVHFASYDSGSLSDLNEFDLRGAIPGVRVADFPRHLFAVRNRLREDPDDETVNGDVRQLVSGLDAVVEKAQGDEAAFLAALTAKPNDYAGWCAYSDWRMERDMPPLLTEVFRLFGAESGSIHDTRNPAKDEIVVQTHVAQASKHVARWGKTDLYHHFILFDDEWANAHRDLAASILRTASRWDPL